MDKDISRQLETLKDLEKFVMNPSSKQNNRNESYLKIKESLITTHLRIREKINLGYLILKQMKYKSNKELNKHYLIKYPQLLRKREFNGFVKQTFPNIEKVKKVKTELLGLNNEGSFDEIQKVFSKIHSEIRSDIQSNKLINSKYESLKKIKVDKNKEFRNLKEDVKEIPRMVKNIKKKIRKKFENIFVTETNNKDKEEFYVSNFEFSKRKLLRIFEEEDLVNQNQFISKFSADLKKNINTLKSLDSLTLLKDYLDSNILDSLKLKINFSEKSLSEEDINIFLLEYKNNDLPILLISNSQGQILTENILSSIKTIDSSASFQNVYYEPENIYEEIVNMYFSNLNFSLTQDLKNLVLNIRNIVFIKKMVLVSSEKFIQSVSIVQSQIYNYKNILQQKWNLNFNLKNQIKNLENKNPELVNNSQINSNISLQDKIFSFKIQEFDVLVIIYYNQYNWHHLISVFVSRTQKMLQIDKDNLENKFLDCLVLNEKPIYIEKEVRVSCKKCKQMEMKFKKIFIQKFEEERLIDQNLFLNIFQQIK